MKIVKVLNLIQFIQGFYKIYNNLNTVIKNKVKNNDYYLIDKNVCTIFRLWFNTDSNELISDLEILSRNFFPKENLIKKLKVNCFKKSTTTIIEELEKKILENYEKIYMQSLIIIYNPLQAIYHPLYSKIISHLKTLRKGIRVKHDIVYEQIIEENILIENILFNLKNNISYGDRNFQHINLVCVKRNKSRFIIFSICLYDMYHIFEIDIKEINIEKFPLSHEITTIYDNDFDLKISKYYCELYKNVYIDDLQNYVQPKMEACSFTEIILDSKFKIEINKDKIKFTQDYDSNKYFLETNSVNLNDGIIISKKCLSEFKYFFKKLSSTMKNKYENNLCVEMFYRLMKTEDKVKFLLERLLNKTDTALCIIFAHLLLNMQIINKAEFKKIIESDELGDTRKTELINIVIEKTYQKNLSAEYLIKFCLLLEAEKFINENKFKCDSIFGTLKIIGSQMNKKKFLMGLKITMNPKMFYKENNIDLTKIMSGITVYGLNRIEKYKRIVSGELIKMTSLFAENKSNVCYNLEDMLFVNKDDVIFNLGLNSNEVINNSKIISVFLSERLHKNSKKYVLALLEPIINNIKQKMSDSTLTKNDIIDFKYDIKIILDNINHDIFIFAASYMKDKALYMGIETIFDNQDVMIKDNDGLQNVEINKIEKLFIYSILAQGILEKISIENIKPLKKDKNDDLKGFYKYLCRKIKESIRIYINREYMEILEILSENERKNPTNIKPLCQKKLLRLQLLISEKDLIFVLLEFLNKIQYDLIKAIKNKI
ncbi:uncharacterized protein VNE69_04080 [Vairimorpha necatrix]|uniref:Uncharacterized protein n=1 Tax=Vairimorpha necatrix TaxID=6039 RepID=A0AAX4JB97_9MICR